MSTILERDIFGNEKRIEELMQQLSDVTWFKRIIDHIPWEITLKNPYGTEDGQWHYFMAEAYSGISIMWEMYPSS